VAKQYANLDAVNAASKERSEKMYNEFVKLWNGNVRNGRVLAEIIGVSDRTIRNYKRRMQDEKIEERKAKKDKDGKPRFELGAYELLNTALRSHYDLRIGKREESGCGLEFRRNARNTFSIARVHYTADPDKRDEAWRNRVSSIMTPRKWQREYEIDYSVHAGEPVYAIFTPEKHVLPYTFQKGLPVLRGWDFGMRRPAVVWAQQRDGHIVVLGSKLGENEHLDKFAKRVIEETELNFPGQVKDFCDPRGEQRTDTGSPSIEVLSSFGIYPLFRYTLINEGVEIIRQKLMTVLDDGLPEMYVSADGTSIGSQMIVDGLAGGYRFKEDRTGAKPHEEPYKDGFYEHLMDALRYIMIVLYRVRKYGSRPPQRTTQMSRWETTRRNQKWLNERKKSLAKRTGQSFGRVRVRSL